MAAVGYIWLERMLILCNGRSSKLARAVGTDRKSKLSFALYAAAIFLAFVHPWIAISLYVAAALIWLVPDRRIESVI